MTYTGATFEGTIGDDTLTVTATGTFESASTGENKTVTISGLTLGGTSAGNYIISDSGNQATATANIAKAPLTVTAKPKTITYGDVPTNDGVTYSGFVNSETEGVLNGSVTYAYSYTQYGNVGSYTITPSGLTSGNYSITFADGILTVEQK